MQIKLYSRPSKDGKNKLYIDYTEQSGRRVRKSLNLLDTKANIAYVYRQIIPQIERKLKYDLKYEEYKLTEFINIVLLHAKEAQKINTFKAYDSAVKKFYAIMGDLDVSKVRAKDIEKYILVLKELGLSSAAINLYLVPIKLAFNEAMRLDIVDKNPVTIARKPTIKNEEKKVFNLMQMHNLLAKADGELKTFLYFAFFTGARPGEISALRWKDIMDNTINIERTAIQSGQENLPKGGKARKIALLKPLKDYLATINKDKEKVFKYSYRYYAKYFCKLVVQSGYERRTLHVTRHTFASLLLKAKEDPTLIQYFLGHSSLNMLNKVYAHYIEDEKDIESVERALAQS